MASTRDKLESLVLSAQEIRQLTGWDDAMTEDYLNIIRNLVQIADSVDEVMEVDLSLIEQNIASVGGLLGKTRGQLGALHQEDKRLEQLIYAW